MRWLSNIWSKAPSLPIPPAQLTPHAGCSGGGREGVCVMVHLRVQVCVCVGGQCDGSESLHTHASLSPPPSVPSLSCKALLGV